MRAEAWPRVRSCQGWGGRALWDAAPLARHPTMAHPPARPPGIGVGTWAWGNQFLWGYDPSQDPMLEATFAAAVAAGLCTFDTADSYGTGRFNGRSEALLGRFVAALPPARRESLCVATKLAPFPWRLGRQGYQRAFEASKHRLGGRVDLVQLHWSTARYAPWQEGPLLDGLADLVQHALEGPEVNLDQAAALPTKVKLYPQDKWAWGWNNSSEVWNGRLAMVGFSAFLLELISGRGPLHALGLL